MIVLNKKFEIFETKNDVIIKQNEIKDYRRITKYLYNEINKMNLNDEELIRIYNQLFTTNNIINNKKKIQFKNVDNQIKKVMRVIPSVLLNFYVSLIAIISSIIIGLIYSKYLPNGDINLGIQYMWLMANILFHELGHAVICKSYKREVISSGIKLNYGFPVFFVNTTDICMSSLKGRIHTNLGGIYFNSLLFILCFTIGILHNNLNYIKPLMNLSFTFIVFNLIPFLKLDGYYLLSDLIDIHNLKDKAKISFIKLIKLEAKSLKEYFLALYYILNKGFFILILYMIIKEIINF